MKAPPVFADPTEADDAGKKNISTRARGVEQIEDEE